MFITHGGDGAVKNVSLQVSEAVRLLREAIALLDAASSRDASAVNKRITDRLLRLPEVQRLTGLCRSAIYEQMQSGAFPRSVKAGAASDDLV